MTWLLDLGTAWMHTLAWFISFALVFGLLTRLTPCDRGMYWWRDLQSAIGDCLYWFVLPLIVNIGRTALAVVAVLLLFGGREPTERLAAQLPLWLACGCVLLLQDVLQYGLHRLFHTRSLWPFHAVHHAPTALDWTAAARFHPLNHLLTFGMADVVVLLLGFSPTVLVTLAPFNVVYSAMVHANLNWTFGPLRYVLASPVFHRWHHTAEEDGLDKNFASTFPWLDLLFGTFYMPPHRLPMRYGDADSPGQVWRQLVEPFRVAMAGTSWRGPLAATLTACLVLVAGMLMRPTDGPIDPGEDESEAVEAPPDDMARSPIVSLALSPAGDWAATGSEDGTVRLWEPTTGRCRHVVRGHSRRVRSLAIASETGQLVSGGDDGKLCWWDCVNGELLRSLEQGSAVSSLAITADGRWLASGAADGSVLIWDLLAAEPIARRKLASSPVLGLLIAPDGERVDFATGRAIGFWHRGQNTTHAWTAHDDLITSLCGSHECLVSGAYDGTIRLWDARINKSLGVFRGHEGAVLSVSATVDQRLIVSAGADGTIRLWDGQAGTELSRWYYPPGLISSVAIKKDGKCIVSGTSAGDILVASDAEH